MLATRIRRALLAFAVLIVTTTLGVAALPSGGAPQARDSLAGQLLVASPDISDPRFAHAVILIVLQDDQGALGIMINRPLGERPLADLLAATGGNPQGVTRSVRVFAGGPVQPTVGFILHSPDYHRPDTVTIDGHVAMTASTAILRDIGLGKGPKKSLIAFGYAGWAPGQLEFEIERHDWITVPEDPGLVFDEDRKTLWERARARQLFPL